MFVSLREINFELVSAVWIETDIAGLRRGHGHVVNKNMTALHWASL
jgi:hypothetical protein